MHACALTHSGLTPSLSQWEPQPQRGFDIKRAGTSEGDLSSQEQCLQFPSWCGPGLARLDGHLLRSRHCPVTKPPAQSHCVYCVADPSVTQPLAGGLWPHFPDPLPPPNVRWKQRPMEAPSGAAPGVWSRYPRALTLSRPDHTCPSCLRTVKRGGWARAGWRIGFQESGITLRPPGCTESKAKHQGDGVLCLTGGHQRARRRVGTQTHDPRDRGGGAPA